jgi:hypothetical protein
MSVHITRYKTENGKTRRITDSSPGGKAAGKNGTPEPASGAEAKHQPAQPAAKGA